MTVVDASWLVVAIFFALYGLACSIECGVVINLLSGDKQTNRSLHAPLWEVTNVFLVFGFTATAVLFNNALGRLNSALLPTLIIGLFALLVRACSAFALSYLRPGSTPKWVVWLFSTTCFLVPLSFSAAGIYLLTGEPFWASIVGFMLMISVLLGIVAIGKLFLDGPLNTKKKWSGLVLYSAWLMVLGSFLPLSIIYSGIGFQKWAVVALDLLSIAGLLIGYLLIMGKYKLQLKYYAAFVGLAAPILMALANSPYLLRGRITLAAAYGPSSYADVFLVGSAIVLPFVILGFWLLLKPTRTAN